MRKAYHLSAKVGGALVAGAAGDDTPDTVPLVRTYAGVRSQESRISAGPGKSVRHLEERALTRPRRTHG